MSNPLELNLAKRPFTNDGLLWAGVGLFTAGVLALSTWNGVQFMATGSQVQALTEKSQALREEKRSASRREDNLLRTIKAARSELLASRATFANTIIKAHSFSWTRLFNELEKVMPLGARVVNIRPRIDDGIRVRINGVARNVHSFWELQDNLEAWPVFGDVYPDALQPTASRAGIMSGELMFSLEMEYFPTARLLLGLPEDAPGPVEAAGDLSAREAGHESPAAEQPSSAEGEGAAPDDQAATATAVPVRGSAPGAERMSTRARPGRRRQGGVGVERKSRLAEGAPGLKKPDINSVQRPERFTGMGLPQVTLAGRNAAGQPLDEDGNVISIEDVINRPGGIKPRTFPVDGSTGALDGVKGNGAGTDKKSAPSNDTRENEE
ncbi:MAG: hypothetical protein E2P00_05705 [Acidobacteria bacterium]|nr:MAG: hypothetical protein E2P00_05705 [Acidobacteriota bacterium]